ncbi:MAG: ATP-binding cassette domain-containing protein [Dehalococcoidia bacterium]|nr:ATP-binding cassette domain-containing protein [Dehalococcoidia bacterium]
MIMSSRIPPIDNQSQEREIEGMNAIEVSQASKSFRGTRAVNDLSFTVGTGEVFGMVGPNGAGKTTTLRMLMDIIKPDTGEIIILGEAINEETKNRIGYLPEERGLYRKITVSESLAYLAALKNMKRRLARDRAAELLERADMLQHKNKKIEELSRGMGQIIQFIATILHDPELIVLDEPFAGLDPVNTELLKGLILELKGQGKSIILSTHMMNQVEELCDRVLMINKGQAVLYGSLGEIKSRFRNNSIFLECDRIPDRLPGVVGRQDHGKYLELFLDGQTPPSKVLSALVNNGVTVDRFEVSTPSLNEIFIQVVKEG